MSAWLKCNFIKLSWVLFILAKGHWNFDVVDKKSGVFWDVMPCVSCEKRRFGRTYFLLRQSCLFAAYFSC
jgi:hypothetical protein